MRAQGPVEFSFFSEFDSSKNILRVIRLLGFNCIQNILVQILLVSRNTWALEKKKFYLFIFGNIFVNLGTNFMKNIKCIR
jgi:hypothetical protein